MTTAVSAPEKVDVAFSFLAQDEALALRLSERLRGRVSTFVFSERQKEIAGRDGVEVFTPLYASTAQFVVVLYREGYGGTKWTRIEASAIRNRALEIGWHTILLISLDGSKPDWIPPSRLWLGIETFGEEIAAEAILGRFAEVGLAPHPETVIDRARRIANEKEGRANAEAWRGTQAAVDAAREQFTALSTLLEQRAAELPALFKPEAVREHHNSVQMRIQGARVSFTWIQAYGNSLSGSELQIREYEHRWPSGGWGRSTWHEVKVNCAELVLDYRSSEAAWTLGKHKESLFTTQQLVDYFLDRLLERHGGREVKSQRAEFDDSF